MPSINFTLSCRVHDSFRVQQIAGMFDVPVADKTTATFQAELPELSEPWQIGLIVGPSGSGKTSVARRAFGEALYMPENAHWPQDRAVVDCFGELSVKEIVGLFTAVGFSSPPSWIKPYAVLSNGERFRCDLARALARGTICRERPPCRSEESAAKRNATEGVPYSSLPLVAFDEFTSVVDRNVARIGAAAVAKGIRDGRIGCRFVAVTCHYDVAEWLTPDWILDMATGRLDRRRLRRPKIEIAVQRCGAAAWAMFARHHYLNGKLNPAARCYLATWNDVPVAFSATLCAIGKKDHWRVSRIVTLPDFQGVGIGMRLMEAVCELHRAEGKRINVTARHPALIEHCRRSPAWRTVGVKRTGSRAADRMHNDYRGSPGRTVVSFEYVGVGATA